MRKAAEKGLIERCWEAFVESMRRLVSASSVPEKPEKLRRSLLRLVFIRVCVLTVVFGSLAYDVSRGEGAEGNLETIFWPIAGIYAISLMNVFALQYSWNLRRIGYIQLIADVFLASFASLVSLSSASPILYLLVVVGGAAVFRKQGAVVLAALSGVCYGLLKIGMLGQGAAPPPSAVELFLVYMSLVAIALISGHVAELVDKLGLIAVEQARNLSDLTKQQEQLFNNISVGIITLDLSSAVTGLNNAARAIMGLTEIDSSNLVGRPLPGVLRDHGVANADELFSVRSSLDMNRPREMRFGMGEGKGEIHLSYIVRDLRDSDLQQTGRIFVFNDISHVKSIEERLNLHEQMTKLLAREEDMPGMALVSSENLLMVGESAIMKQVFALVDRVAASDASVLITGESGTGKEVIAKAIHARGPRRLKPFVGINCGAIPESLLESELFGHKKGAFTGAVSDNPGLFRQAQNGTLFLDEVGELPPHMQTKLLRVLQERRIRAVGDVHDLPVDVRVIAATNRDLKSEIAKGAFREDLFYRLNVVNIRVPPLRERKEDIPLLVRHFVGRMSGPDRLLPIISPEALQTLTNYPFPGNIRELENLIERALVLGGHAILPEHFPEEVRARARGDSGVLIRPDSAMWQTEILVLPIDLEGMLSRIEREYLLKALERSGGLKKQAAELLGLNFRSFRYRLKKYGMGEGSQADLDDNVESAEPGPGDQGV